MDFVFLICFSTAGGTCCLLCRLINVNLHVKIYYNLCHTYIMSITNFMCKRLLIFLYLLSFCR